MIRHTEARDLYTTVFDPVKGSTTDPLVPIP